MCPANQVQCCIRVKSGLDPHFHLKIDPQRIIEALPGAGLKQEELGGEDLL